MTDLDDTLKTAKELVGNVISGYHSMLHNATLDLNLGMTQAYL